MITENFNGTFSQFPGSQTAGAVDAQGSIFQYPCDNHSDFTHVRGKTYQGTRGVPTRNIDHHVSRSIPSGSAEWEVRLRKHKEEIAARRGYVI